MKSPNLTRKKSAKRPVLLEAIPFVAAKPTSVPTPQELLPPLQFKSKKPASSRPGNARFKMRMQPKAGSLKLTSAKAVAKSTKFELPPIGVDRQPRAAVTRRKFLKFAGSATAMAGLVPKLSAEWRKLVCTVCGSNGGSSSMSLWISSCASASNSPWLGDLPAPDATRPAENWVVDPYRGGVLVPESDPYWPPPTAKDPGSNWLLHNIVVGGGNFPGAGWADMALTRPVQLFDLAAKIHDFTYALNGLVFNGTGNSSYQSKMAKANFIFNAMNYKVISLFTTPSPILDLYTTLADHLVLPGSISDFLSGDGFVSTLQYAGLTTPATPTPPGPGQYLMIPWNSLPDDQRANLMKPETIQVGHHGTGTRMVPDYNKAAPLDSATDWQDWAGSTYGSTFWSSIRRITGSTDNSYVLYS